jgi:hypothetical protein
MTYYKVLVDGRSCFGGKLEWSLPTMRPDGNWEPGDWMAVSGPIELCYRGLHLTTDPYGQWVSWNMTVYEAEHGEIVDHKRDKLVSDRARLLRPVTHPVWWEETVRLVEYELPTARWFRPDGDPDPTWRLFVSPTWEEAAKACFSAAAEAGMDPYADPPRTQAVEAAIAAADEAGRKIPRQIANGIAIERAERAAKRAALAARDRTGDAPMEAAQDGADFVHDLVVVRGICADLPLAPEHRVIFDALWEIYKKGYVPGGWVGDRRGVYTRQSRRARSLD